MLPCCLQDRVAPNGRKGDVEDSNAPAWWSHLCFVSLKNTTGRSKCHASTASRRVRKERKYADLHCACPGSSQKKKKIIVDLLCACPGSSQKGKKIIVTFPTENVRGTCTWQESTASHFNRNIEAAKLALLSVFLFDRNFSNLKGSVAWLPPAPNIMQESFGTCTIYILEFLSRNDKGLPWWSRHTKKSIQSHDLNFVLSQGQIHWSALLSSPFARLQNIFSMVLLI